MAFVDECKILFKAGNGGDGIVSWRREAHVPLGGPAGGDGGNGGSIFLVGDHNENSLQDLKFRKLIIASNGEKGSIKTMHGRNGSDVYVKVPIGTMVYDENNHLLVDILAHNQEYVICEGGCGGYGNFHFKSGFNKAPSLYELGDKGEIKECRLVLKQIADIGIVGLPNAGKSTFISKISNAKPKTANYQFTTLNPILGTIYYNDNKIIFADIPGLIKGASDGLGLGHNFLRHIERTKVLIHLVSLDDIDNSSAIDAYKTIMDELANYSVNLINKPMIIVANKMDVDNYDEKYRIFSQFFNDIKIYQASTELNQGLAPIIEEACQLVMRERTNSQQTPSVYKVEVVKSKEDVLNKTLKIEKILDNVWNVECDFLKYWADKIPLNTQDNAFRFNQKMQTVNVEGELKKMGAVKGDTIKIYHIEMQYEN